MVKLTALHLWLHYIVHNILYSCSFEHILKHSSKENNLFFYTTLLLKFSTQRHRKVKKNLVKSISLHK